MARKRVSNKDAGKNECCRGKNGRIVACGAVLVAIAAAIKYGISLSDLLLLIGLIFIVKGLLLSAFRK